MKPGSLCGARPGKGSPGGLVRNRTRGEYHWGQEKRVFEEEGYSQQWPHPKELKSRALWVFCWWEQLKTRDCSPLLLKCRKTQEVAPGTFLSFESKHIWASAREGDTQEGPGRGGEGLE